MLAEQRQCLGVAGLLVLQGYLANPLCIGGRSAMTGQSVFIVARLHAVVAAFSALVTVDQHAPAHFIGNGLAGRSGMSDFMQHHPGRHGHAGHGGGAAAEEATSVLIELRLVTHG